MNVIIIAKVSQTSAEHVITRPVWILGLSTRTLSRTSLTIVPTLAVRHKGPWEKGSLTFKGKPATKVGELCVRRVGDRASNPLRADSPTRPDVKKLLGAKKQKFEGGPGFEGHSPTSANAIELGRIADLVLNAFYECGSRLAKGSHSRPCGHRPEGSDQL